MEQEIGQLQAQVAAPDFFSQPHETTQPWLTAITQAEDALEQAFTRWETLEAQKNSASEHALADGIRRPPFTRANGKHNRR